MGEGDVFSFVEVVVVVVVVEVVMVVVVVVVVVVVGRGSLLGLDPLVSPTPLGCSSRSFALFRAILGVVLRASRFGVALGGALDGSLGVLFLGCFGRGW